MKQPPYFKLTEVESQVTLWAGLMLMLIIVVLMIVLARQQPINDYGAQSAGAQANAQQQQNLVRALQQAFATESQQGRINILKTPTSIQIAINTRQLFSPREAELSLTGKNILNRLAQTLKTLPDISYQKIQIEGYIERDLHDAANYPHDGWELVSGQAVSALKYLAAAAHLKTGLFSVHSYADSRLSPASKTEDERTTNQRLVVNIFLTAHQS